MKFEEFGLENEKTLLLLPGTGCTWQINFGEVKEELEKKYEKRYLQHFANPDIIRFDMGHEVWMFDDKWCKPVMEAIETRMEGYSER